MRPIESVITDHAEDDAPERPRREAEREHRERQELTRRRARLGEELLADVGREVAVDREVEPLEDVPDDARGGGSKGGLLHEVIELAS
jgi:hypothetical protein